MSYSDADCTPAVNHRSVAASCHYYYHHDYYYYDLLLLYFYNALVVGDQYFLDTKR